MEKWFIRRIGVNEKVPALAINNRITVNEEALRFAQGDLASWVYGKSGRAKAATC